MRRDTAPGTTRRALVAGCVGDNGDGDGNGGDGAGDNDSDAATPDSNPATGEVTQMGDLTLTSPTFDDGDPY